MYVNNVNPFSDSKWIGGQTEAGSPIIIRRFNIEKIKSATLYVTGLGYFETKINNKLVTDAKFIPVISDYEPRDLHKLLGPKPENNPTVSIYYYKYDVKNFIKEGSNIMTIQLGDGWYRQKERVLASVPSDFGTGLC